MRVNHNGLLVLGVFLVESWRATGFLVQSASEHRLQPEIATKSYALSFETESDTRSGTQYGQYGDPFSNNRSYSSRRPGDSFLNPDERSYSRGHHRHRGSYSDYSNDRFRDSFPQQRTREPFSNDRFARDAFPQRGVSAPLTRYREPYSNDRYNVDSSLPQERTIAPLTRYMPRRRRMGARDTMPSNSRIVQGGSRWSPSAYPYSYDPYTHIQLRSESRYNPVNAEVELWDGPNNAPGKMRVYSEDGNLRPFNARIGTASPSGGGGHVMSVRNSGPLEFPLSAGMRGYNGAGGGYNYATSGSARTRSETIHGGDLKTYSFDSSVSSVYVELETEGLPLIAKVELWQGPSNVKQIAEVYLEDGRRPFSATIETPGHGSTIAIRNEGSMTFPLRARLQPQRW